MQTGTHTTKSDNDWWAKGGRQDELNVTCDILTNLKYQERDSICDNQLPIPKVSKWRMNHGSSSAINNKSA